MAVQAAPSVRHRYDGYAEIISSGVRTTSHLSLLSLTFDVFPPQLTLSIVQCRTLTPPISPPPSSMTLSPGPTTPVAETTDIPLHGHVSVVRTEARMLRSMLDSECRGARRGTGAFFDGYAYMMLVWGS